MTTLENRFPLLAVEHGCIISKDADITVAFEVELPELYTVTGAAFTGGHIIHGCANAMYLPKVIKYNSKDPVAAERYAKIAKFINLKGETTEELVDALIAELRSMNDQLNIPQGIKNYGPGGVKADESIIDEKEFLEKLPEVAKNAIADACTGSNPRQPNQEEMEKLLKACYYDTEIDF